MTQTEKPVPTVPPAANPAASAPPVRRPAAPAIPLDWLEDIRQIEESLQLRLPPVPAKPTLLPTAPAATPTKRSDDSTRVLPPPTAVPAARPSPPIQIAPGRTTTVVPVPAAPSIPQPTGRHAPPTQIAPVRATFAETAPPNPEQMGYDPETGRVLDAAVHARWQKVEALRRQQELAQQSTPSVAGEEKGTRLGRGSFSLAHAPATSESIATKEFRFFVKEMSCVPAASPFPFQTLIANCRKRF